MADRRSKADVLALIGEQRAELDATLADIREAEMALAGVIGEWSVKDVLAHITSWEQWLLRLLRGDAEAVSQLRVFRGAAGDALVDEMNAATYAAHRDDALADVRATFAASYHEALRAVADLTDETLAHYERVVAGNTWEHYAEHTPMLRAWLDQRRGTA